MNKNLNYRKLPQKPFKVVNMQYQNDRKMGSFCQSMLHRKSFEKTYHCALARKHGPRNYYISSGTFCKTFTQFKALLFSWILVLLNTNFALFCRFHPNEDKSGILNFSSNPKLIQTAGIPRYLPRKFSQWEKDEANIKAF